MDLTNDKIKNVSCSSKNTDVSLRSSLSFSLSEFLINQYPPPANNCVEVLIQQLRNIIKQLGFLTAHPLFGYTWKACGKHEERKKLERSRHRREDNIQIDLM